MSAEDRVRVEAKRPDGWGLVDHVEAVEEDDAADPEVGLELWSKGDKWRHTTLEVDAYMSGPSDRWEADRQLRDLAHELTAAAPDQAAAGAWRSQME